MNVGVKRQGLQILVELNAEDVSEIEAAALEQQRVQEDHGVDSPLWERTFDKYSMVIVKAVLAESTIQTPRAPGK